MICDQAMQLMSAALDGELTQAEQQDLQAHLNQCEECRRLYDAMNSIEQEVSALAEPAPAGLKQGILYRIGRESGGSKAPRRRFFGVGTGFGLVAAALVLLLGTGVIRLPHPETKTAAETAAAPETQILDLDRAESTGVNFGNIDLNDSKFAVGKNDVLSPNGQQNEDGDSPVSNEAGWETISNETSGLPSETVAAPNSGSPDIRLHKRPVGVQARVACQTLSMETRMPLLLYSEFTDESLFALLAEAEPDLWRQVEAFLPEQMPEADPETGLIVYEMDYQTVLAVQEWLVQHLTAEAEQEERPVAAHLTELMENLDPGSDCLFRVIHWETPEAPVAWPELWPEEWNRRFLSRDNWALFLPDEKAMPGKTDPACLIFQAPNN